MYVTSDHHRIRSTLNVKFSVYDANVQKYEELTDRIVYKNITRKGLLYQFLYTANNLHHFGTFLYYMTEDIASKAVLITAKQTQIQWQSPYVNTAGWGQRNSSPLQSPVAAAESASG